jgi:hypothetical protein
LGTNGFLGNGFLAIGKESPNGKSVLIGFPDTGRGKSGFPDTGKVHHLQASNGFPDIVDRKAVGSPATGNKQSISNCFLICVIARLDRQSREK